MKKINVMILAAALVSLTLGSCKKYLDINTDPDRIPATNPPAAQLLTNAQINQANDVGGDLWRYSGLIVQYVSGQASQPNQTYEYGRYNISGSDNNNIWLNIYANTLSDLELVIKNAAETGSPHYSGVAKIMKAYEYQLVVDTWGDVPYTEATKLALNRAPKYDNDEDIYKSLITMLNEGIAEVNAATSNTSPSTNSLIYTSSSFNAAAKLKWTKFANTLKLRILLHYSKKDPAFMVSQMNALIASGAQFFTSNADNYEFAFKNDVNARNPIDQFERSRSNYLFADDFFVSMLNSRNDPRRATYFTPFPFNSSPATYKGVKPEDPAVVNYSRMHTYLRGAVVSTASNAINAQGGIISSIAITYTGDAPIRMVTYAEYCFIRAEAALRGVGATTDAQLWFTRGVTASMEQAGVSAANITTYLATNGTLAGTTAAQIAQVITEKYIALYGVAIEPWTDYRRTGVPPLVAPSNAVETAVPRSLYYPQSEIDLNPSNPGQKANLQARVFWDTP
jgi:hypothetical protein